MLNYLAKYGQGQSGGRPSVPYERPIGGLAQSDAESPAFFSHTLFGQADAEYENPDYLAQVEADFPWMHAMVHGNSLAQVDTESDAQAGRY